MSLKLNGSELKREAPKKFKKKLRRAKSSFTLGSFAAFLLFLVFKELW